MMLMQAAAKQWNVPAAECTAANGVITHTPSGRKTTYGKVAAAAAKIDAADRISSSRTRRTGRSSARASSGSTPPTRCTGKQIYGIDVKLPGMVNAAIGDCPVFGGKLKSFDAAKVDRHARRQEGGAGRRQRASRWSPTPGGTPRPRSRRCPIVWDEGAERQGVQRHRSRNCSRTASMPSRPIVGNKGGDARRRSPARPRRSRRSTAIPISTTSPWSRRTPPRSTRPTNARSGSDAERRAGAGGGLRGVRHAGRQMRVYKTFLGGGFGRRGLGRLRAPGRAHRQGDARHAGEADLVARRGHDARLVSSDHAVQDDRPASTTRGNLTALHMRISGQSILATVAPERMQNGMDPATFAGFYKGGREGAFGYDDAEYPDRPCDAQSACAAGLLARRQHQPQRHLHRKLHGRAGEGGRPIRWSSAAS